MSKISTILEDFSSIASALVKFLTELYKIIPLVIALAAVLGAVFKRPPKQKEVHPVIELCRALMELVRDIHLMIFG
jgi:hypothetical protein